MDWLLLTPGEPSGCKRERGTTRHKSPGDAAHGPADPALGAASAGLQRCCLHSGEPRGNSWEQQLRALQLDPAPATTVWMHLIEQSHGFTGLAVLGSLFPGFSCGGFLWKGLGNGQMWFRRQTGARGCDTKLVSAFAPRSGQPKPAWQEAALLIASLVSPRY